MSKGNGEPLKLFNHPIVLDSDVPLRDQVKTILKEEIHAGRWKAGDRMATARELSQMSGISATTITHALSQLHHEGYMERHVGRGSYLRPLKVKARSRTNVIGLILGESWVPGHSVSSRLPFFHELMARMDRELGHWGFATRLFHHYGLEQMDEETQTPRLSQTEIGSVDGLLNIGMVEPILAEQVRDHYVPLVSVATTESPRGVPYVTVDDRHEMWELVDHLHAAGHRKIGLLHSLPDLHVRRLRSRFDAFVGACEQYGLSCPEHWLRFVGDEEHVNFAAIRDFMTAGDRPTAVVCLGHTVAKAVYDVAAILGERIPDALSLVCTTPHPNFGQNLEAPISTMVTDTPAIAEEATKLLVQLIRQGHEGVAPVSGLLIRSIWTPRASVLSPSQMKAAAKLVATT